ncbi:hypothetical protein D9613_001487 [Agrocybe pediades]|uniref:Uncharacterized protein n=1 Tax=Agrocybe pediades TaxID=84607 RepID=A0A8H4R660_9AGAR|nr:hypothetical protein D9613_001487 [Agrocybe pediades]
MSASSEVSPTPAIDGALKYNSTINVNNAVGNTTLRVIGFGKTQGEWNVPPVDVSLPSGPKTCVLTSTTSGGVDGSQGFVKYKLEGSNTVYQLLFSCVAGQENSVTVNDTKAWKIDYNKAGDLLATVTYIGGVAPTQEDSLTTSPEMNPKYNAAVTINNGVANTTLRVIGFGRTQGEWELTPVDVSLLSGPKTFTMHSTSIGGVDGSQGFVKYKVKGSDKPIQLLFSCVAGQENSVQVTDAQAWRIDYNKAGDLNATLTYIGQLSLAAAEAEPEGIFDHSSTITFINRSDFTTLYLNEFRAIRGTWDITPTDYIAPGKAATFKIKGAFAPPGSEGRVTYRYPGTNATSTLFFACGPSFLENNWMRADVNWKVLFNKIGPLHGTFEYIGEVHVEENTLTAPIANGLPNVPMLDRSSTITVINTVPNVTLLVDSYKDVHGSWDKSPSNVTSGKADTFKLKDNFGWNGSEGWVKYKVLVGSQVVKIVTISFACPNYDNNWMKGGDNDGWKIEYNEKGPLFGTFEYVHQG